MDKGCNTKNPLLRGGTNQSVRFPAALAPSYISVDEKNIDDLLVQLKNYAEQVKFIGFEKDLNDNWVEKDDGNWLDFFEKDISFILSFISTKDCEKIQFEYNDTAEKLNKYIKDETKAKEKYTELFNIINNAANELTSWKEKINEDHYLYSEIKNEIYCLSDSYVLLSTYEPSIFLTGSGTVLLDKLEESIDVFAGLFNSFLRSYTKIVNSAKKYLAVTLESDSEHNPQAALLLTFLKLFQLAQINLNNFTERHLDFYYRDVLHMYEKAEMPDSVHIIFELAKNVSSYLLEKGTILSAGKDSLGKEILFSLDSDIVINTAKVELLKNVFVDKENSYLVCSSPVANSADGIGGALPKDNPKWDTFGKSQYDDGSLIETASMTFAEIGIAIASPVLLLQEGTRIIDLDFELTDSSLYSKSDFENAFIIHFSGEKDWIKAESYTAKDTPGIQITLPAETPSIINYNPEKLGGNFNSGYPIVKLILNTELSSYQYEKFKDYKITNITITVNVSNVTNVIIQNDLGVQKTGKPFQPFGPQPSVNSSFYIGSTEIFSKKLDTLDINVAWHEVPDMDLGSYYSVYASDIEATEIEATGIDETYFSAKLSLLNKGSWGNVIKENVQLFNQDATAPITYKFGKEFSSLTGYEPDPQMEHTTSYEVNTMRGFIKLVLTPHDFFHQKYTKLYTQKILDKGTLPNPPYTPVIREISLSYTSTEQIEIDSSDGFDTRTSKLFHIYPFGQKETHPFLDNSGTSVSMFPQFVTGKDENNGELYIGLSNLKAPQSLSLLFQAAEGSSDPNVCKPEVTWHYLSSNNWVTFADSQILTDDTDGLVNSGIIIFDIPGDIVNTNSLLDTGYYWLKASVTANTAGVCDLINVSSQAIKATYSNNGNDPERLAVSLSAGTISKLKSKESAIKKLSQPYSSFGGAVKEQSQNYYRRVSERLRHKHRAITIWDYERIVLEAFPEIYKVKCLNHTKLVQCEDCGFTEHSLSPGHVTIITIPVLKNKNAVDPFKPYTSIGTLTKIDEYLVKLISPFICLYVNNPKFEQIQVDFEVKFFMEAGGDVGYYKKKLNEDIKKFLSPWAYDEGKDISFGGKLHKTVILDYIEDLEYVDYLTNFKMNHIDVADDIDEAVATSSRSVLVTISDEDYTKEHKIKEILELSSDDGISNYCKKPEASC